MASKAGVSIHNVRTFSHYLSPTLCSFDLSREVVAVSIDLFDRYLATQGNKCSGNLALLTSLTTLHIAIKLHDCKKIKLSTLVNLSRGQFGTNHIEEMEWEILVPPCADQAIYSTSCIHPKSFDSVVQGSPGWTVAFVFELQ